MLYFIVLVNYILDLESIYTMRYDTKCGNVITSFWYRLNVKAHPGAPVKILLGISG